MGSNVWVIDVPAHTERIAIKHYHDYNFVPFKLTLQGIEFGQVEEGREMPKEQTGLKPTIYASGLILGGMMLWSFSKGSGGQLALPSLLGALK